MQIEISRRGFVAGMAGLAVGGALPAGAATFKGTIRQAMIVGHPNEKNLAPLKEAGFAGVEATAIIPRTEAEKSRQIAEKLGMRIHSVMRGWADFNLEPAKAEATFKITQNALHAAAGYGADAILLVPCRIGVKPMPQPWEFDIEFDESNGHITRVIKGDNAPYAKYIEAHNHATDTSREYVKRLIPLAEELKVIVALENVWNNLWVKPAIYRHFVASFDHPLVRSYFDIGNHVKYAPPQEWIAALGRLIAKLHIKDFKLNADGHGGKFVHPRDGSIDWPVVRQALDTAGYDGWASIEDGGLPLAEFKRRFDLIVEGK